MKPGGASRPPDPTADGASIGVPLSEGQAGRLLRYLDLLRRRAIPMGMVARGDADRLYHRHVLDSLLAATAFHESDRLAYDLGSGAGLPGVVLAVALPHVEFFLVESRARRAGFLELAAEILELGNVEVAARRAEDLQDGADVVTTRAFAPLERSWEVAHGLLRPGGRLVHFAGAGASRLEQAARSAPSVAEVSVRRVLASHPPLVIMSRT